MTVVSVVARVRLIPRAWRELAAVALTALVHVCWPEAWSNVLKIVQLVVGWVAHVVITARADPSALEQWGLRREGLVPSLLAVGALMGIAAPAMVGYGLLTGAPFGWTLLICLVLYPVWGLVQQLLVQGVVTGGLTRLPVPGARAIAVLGSSALFGLVHWAEPVLVGATFLLGLVLAPIWLRWRNLWPLGLAHGWLGAVVYFAVLHRDPLAGYLVGPFAP